MSLADYAVIGDLAGDPLRTNDGVINFTLRLDLPPREEAPDHHWATTESVKGKRKRRRYVGRHRAA